MKTGPWLLACLLLSMPVSQARETSKITGFESPEAVFKAVSEMCAGKEHHELILYYAPKERKLALFQLYFNAYYASMFSKVEGAKRQLRSIERTFGLELLTKEGKILEFRDARHRRKIVDEKLEHVDDLAFSKLLLSYIRTFQWKAYWSTIRVFRGEMTELEVKGETARAFNYRKIRLNFKKIGKSWWLAAE